MSLTWTVTLTDALSPVLKGAAEALAGIHLAMRRLRDVPAHGRGQEADAPRGAQGVAEGGAAGTATRGVEAEEQAMTRSKTVATKKTAAKPTEAEDLAWMVRKLRRFAANAAAPVRRVRLPPSDMEQWSLFAAAALIGLGPTEGEAKRYAIVAAQFGDLMMDERAQRDAERIAPRATGKRKGKTQTPKGARRR